MVWEFFLLGDVGCRCQSWNSKKRYSCSVRDDYVTYGGFFVDNQSSLDTEYHHREAYESQRDLFILPGSSRGRQSTPRRLNLEVGFLMPNVSIESYTTHGQRPLLGLEGGMAVGRRKHIHWSIWMYSGQQKWAITEGTGVPSWSFLLCYICGYGVDSGRLAWGSKTKRSGQGTDNKAVNILPLSNTS